jgi:HNH endonuclease
MDPKLRLFVRTRANHRCEYCGTPQELSELRFHIEHIIPRQHGGIDDAANLALACPDCNLRKGPNLSGLDPDTGEIAAICGPNILSTKACISSAPRPPHEQRPLYWR